MSVVPRITICARAGAAALLWKTTAAMTSAITQPASAILRNAVLLVFFIASIAPHPIHLQKTAQIFALAFGRVGHRVIRGPVRGAQGPAALDQQQNTDHRPENVARFANDGQGHTRCPCVLKYVGDFSGTSLVNTRTQRNEFEQDVNDPIDRLKNKSGQERRRMSEADETKRDVNLHPTRQMKPASHQNNR